MSDTDKKIVLPKDDTDNRPGVRVLGYYMTYPVFRTLMVVWFFVIGVLCAVLIRFLLRLFKK
ncbi:hypothetical protein TetV_103 [Tetraselmis virus 1]|uniref:Uncharacterized protein n=1 Tax=Tetraselmis virus 1 TaxID=2060617 RepID=A0A2P0VMR3_9VIRU|nr:hypothetical protein QJ968_gp103 [Tetraselmis virus 1]AUF82195.1 hypothetical protein TetV_103 [Tetraselmis virus 1]